MKQKEALELLESCERELRKLLAGAAGEGDYAGVLRITEWARAIAALAAEGRAGALDRPAVDGAQRSSSRASPSGRIPTQSKRGRPDNYPRFYRRGDELVKVGWSKKERREYSHRAPRVAVNSVAAAVRNVGARGRLFNGEALLPVKDSAGGAVPDYQAYVALAWLKHLGLVEQRGIRSGYTVAREREIEETIAAAWPALAEWRGVMRATI